MDVGKIRSDFKKNSLYLIGIPLAVIIFISTLILYNSLRTKEITYIKKQVQDETTIASFPIETIIKQNIATLTRMGKRWEVSKGTPERDWYLDASNLYQDYKIFEGISWVDKDMVLQWLVPNQFIKKYQFLDLSKIPARHDLLMKAMNSKHPIISKITTFMNGSQGYLVVVPLFVDNQLDGFIVGAINTKKMFQNILIPEVGKNYGIAIYQDDLPIYASGNQLENPFLTSKRLLNIYNMGWVIYVWPTKHLLNSIHSSLPIFALLSGSLVALLMLITFYFYNKSNIHAERILISKNDAEEISNRLQTIIQTVNEGFISLSDTGSIILMNRYAEEILGWQEHEVINKNAYDLFIPEKYRKRIKQSIENYLKTGHSEMLNKEVEFIAIARDKHEFPVEVVIFPINEKGKITFHAFIRDISIRKKEQIDQARFTSIIDASDDSIVTMDMEGKILTWNKGAESLYGYKSKEIIGKPISILYPETSKQDLIKIMRSIRDGDHIHYNDTERLHKSGELIPVSVTITPIRSKKNKIIGALSIGRDIRALKKIDTLKNEFISIVSHELRTPLTSIRGSLGILASEKLCPLNEKAKQLLDIANTNSERLIRLINDILDIEKIEAGKMVFHFKLLNLNNLLQDSINANQDLANRHHVRIQFVGDEEFNLVADHDRLTQVMFNLLSNAIRYSPNDCVVTVTLKKISENQVRISVIDQGPGIPAEFQNKIFGKFNQADSSDKRKVGGTGLGLNISRAIIEKHHGHLGFLSGSKVGTTFYFDLPLTQPKSVSHNDNENIQGSRILICDHNERNALYLEKLLSTHDIEVNIAHTAEEARKLLMSNHYDLMTLDLLLPDEDGISFIKSLRSNEKTSNLPIIVISVKAKEGHKKLNGDGFQVLDWIEKPVTEKQLNNLIGFINTKFMNKIPRILSIEDDMDVVQVIKTLLQDKAKVWSATTLTNAKMLLEKYEFDLIILDLNMPDGYGTSLLPCINKNSKSLIPVIVFSIDQLEEKFLHLVNETLLKSVATNEQLFNAILSAIKSGKKYERERIT